MSTHDAMAAEALTSFNDEEISSFVNELAREYFMDAPDRRSEPRYSITLPVILRPTNADFQPVGTLIRAVTRDLSAGGIGLTCQDPVNSNIIVDFASSSGRRLIARAHVLRCVAKGYYFDVGCKFVVS